MQLTGRAVTKTGLVALGMLLAIILLAVAINSGEQAKAYTGYGPPINNLAPSGTINTTSASVYAYFEWFEGEGTETITLDGSTLTNCTGTFSYPNGIDPWWWSERIHKVSCPVSGLTEGSHTIDVRAQYTSDAYGNPDVGPISYDTGTFTVSTTPAGTAGRPSISLGAAAPRWGSIADFNARLLSIDWTISNTGVDSAYSVSMTNTSNTNGVTNSGSATAGFGTINGGASVMKTLKYNIPVTVGSWHTVNTATAMDGVGTSYNYGG